MCVSENLVKLFFVMWLFIEINSKLLIVIFVMLTCEVVFNCRNC